MSDPSSSDLYSRLGLAHDATAAAIKQSYRKCALANHPDKGGDPEVFKLIAEAYAVLSDAEKRRVYDATGEASLAELDLDGMMADVFADGGWFEQQIATDPEMRELMAEEGMENMQKSFGSFFASAMGGGGPVYLPDGTKIDAPKIKMPSLNDLIKDATDDDERELMMRVQKKMGIGERGALVPGTGMQALNMLQSLGSDPSFWSDHSDEEDEDAFLDDLKAELRAGGSGGGGGSGGSGGGGGGGRSRAAGDHKKRGLAASGRAPAGGGGSKGGGGATADAETMLWLQRHGAGPSAAATAASAADESDDDGEEEGTSAARCTAAASVGKAWLDAARNGQAKDLASLLTENPTIVHYRGVGLGQTALHWAATKGHEAIVQWLLRNHAPLEAKNANGARPLHAAASAGSTAVVSMLLAAGVKVGARDDDGKSAERIARDRGHGQLAELLCAGGASGGSSGGGGGGGGGGGKLQVEPAQRRRAVASATPDVGDNDDEEEEELDPLCDAATRGDATALSSALESLCDAEMRLAAVRTLDRGGLSPLHLTCRAGGAECVAVLLSARADGMLRSTKGNTPLAVAAKHSNWDAAIALLDGGVGADGLGLLHAVRRKAASRLQQRMVDAGGLKPDPKAAGRSALMAAAAAGDASSVSSLLALKADVAMQDASEAQALHYCADKGDVRSAALLIEANASLAATDMHGNTPLHAAGRRGKEKLWRVLVNAGADQGAMNERGRPPKLLDEADADAACTVS